MALHLPASGLAAVMLLASTALLGQEPCQEGTLFEPYSQVCAPINDRRDWWLSPSQATAKIDQAGVTLPNLDGLRGLREVKPRGPTKQKSTSDDPPEPGALTAGTTYLDGELSANDSGRLHTKMYVQPDGLNPSGFLGWTFTPATNRVDSAVEVVGIYRTALGDAGVLSIFGRPCSVAYPCPDGDTANGWQPSKFFTELGCNITQIVDAGGHAQKVLHYANHSDRLDNGDPPLWKNAVYLWNYCAEEWDLIWEHTYREAKRDCSVEGCFWWGPAFELTGDPFPRPEINELGYADSLLYHDGTWSQLAPTETGFRNPEDRPDLSPWLLFHSEPNRGFGSGNHPNLNDPPTVTGQAVLTMLEDTALAIGPADLSIDDPDIDPAYHVSFLLSVLDGDNYTPSETTITPDQHYYGDLTVPVLVNDGALDSAVYNLLVEVLPVNDPPTVHAPIADHTLDPGTTIQLDVADAFTDADQEPLAFAVTGLPISVALTSAGLIEGTVTYQDGPNSPYTVVVTATDGHGEVASDTFQMVVVFVDDDGDGLPDAWELEFGLDPADPEDAALDPDDDGLTTLAEFNASTDPNRSDTDRDGLSDGYELGEGLDPLDGVCPSWICADSRRGWRLKLLRRDD